MNNDNNGNIDDDWMSNPILEGISKEKFDVVKSLIEKSKSLDSKELIPFFISESGKAAGKGIYFNSRK